ncbi:hypothetical protein BST81_05665 [Leptolyngbya sp. 'hensonii']|uniref:hypothetical protein n=1 Tax=Leptolyngbya sp. 'hensonii' TaxID=1922337 RepID=UPI00094FCBF6|nr:hypothetical protein [Leptolyngbya sp. 'hensonii']OLP19248.1 hypothetical protein BST81_05665 [Leptolyngbya sp. 'hensonii']
MALPSPACGDFPTPPDLVTAVLRCLQVRGDRWPRVLEPTCGTGNFIRGLLALTDPPREIWAIEANTDYVDQVQYLAQQSVQTQIWVRQAHLFDVPLQHLPWQTSGPLLVMGNPPWVTNARLGSLGSANLPAKRNLRRLRGIDALTGASNFDLAEAVWCKLIEDLLEQCPTIALLCKTAVARRILQIAWERQWPIGNGAIHTIEARRWFGAAVGACLFHLEITSATPCYEVGLYPDLEIDCPTSRLSLAGKKLIANATLYQQFSFLEGRSGIIWRQGVKHDAAPVMELTQKGPGRFQNQLGETVDIEPAYLYPLLKSSDLFRDRSGSQRAVIVTQTRLGQDTAHLEKEAPRLWRYLQHHQAFFARRKSSLYQNKPAFSMFGVGDYTFSPYKVAIAGFYAEPRFRLLTSVHDRPMLLDDTCYFLPCHSLDQAQQIQAFLSSPPCLGFIQAQVFPDAKRPITKKLLQSIQLPD